MNRSKRKRGLLWRLGLNSMESFVAEEKVFVVKNQDESEEDPSDNSGLGGFNSAVRERFARQVRCHHSCLSQSLRR